MNEQLLVIAQRDGENPGVGDFRKVLYDDVAAIHAGVAGVQGDLTRLVG